MMKLIPVQGNSSLARDVKTGAIVNINSNEIQQARERKKAMKQKDNDFEQVKQDVAGLKDDISEIKQILRQLVEKQ
jgi:uncharacterized protein YpuA (DUF1002 family)